MQRRAHIAGTHVSLHGRWSLVWARRVVTWQSHLERSRDRHVWAAHLLSVRNAQWLRLQRARHAPVISRSLRPWTALAGRTATRATRGHVAIRWEDGMLEAHEVVHDEKQRQHLEVIKPKRKRQTSLNNNPAAFENFALIRTHFRRYRDRAWNFELP